MTKQSTQAIVMPINQHVTEIQVTYKNPVKYKDMDKISNSNDAVEVFRKIWSDKLTYVEEFLALYLNRANKVLGWTRISSGGLSGCVVDPRMVFQTALKSNASSLIISHNHPSGNKYPSESDKRLTQKLKKGGKFLDIPVLDHIILTEEEFHSFADENEL